jgi:hypothetical protein
LLVNTICEQRRAREAELAGSTSPIQRALAETLREPELQICETQERWRFREGDQSEESFRLDSANDNLARWFAAMVEYALWFGVGVFAGVTAWWLWRQRPRARGSRPRRATAQKIQPLLGRNQLLASPNPELGADAWRLWTAGQPREALRLLYRGSLLGLTIRHGLPISASATEDDCLRLAAAQLSDPELLGFIHRLTCAWQATAYAHRPPNEAEARNLCQGWPRHFAATGAPPG